jgi:hypothetical protein
VTNEGKRETILNSHGVKVTVVGAGSEATVRLGGEEDRCPARRGGGTDKAIPQVRLDPLLEFFKLFLGQVVDGLVRGKLGRVG